MWKRRMPRSLLIADRLWLSGWLLVNYRLLWFDICKLSVMANNRERLSSPFSVPGLSPFAMSSKFDMDGNEGRLPSSDDRDPDESECRRGGCC